MAQQDGEKALAEAEGSEFGAGEDFRQGNACAQPNKAYIEG